MTLSLHSSGSGFTLTSSSSTFEVLGAACAGSSLVEVVRFHVFLEARRRVLVRVGVGVGLGEGERLLPDSERLSPSSEAVDGSAAGAERFELCKPGDVGSRDSIDGDVRLRSALSGRDCGVGSAATLLESSATIVLLVRGALDNLCSNISLTT